jgi:hypothetical protein
MTIWTVTVEAYGHMSIRRVEAQDAAEAREKALEDVGVRVTVRPPVNVDEQIAKARAEQ